MSALSYRRGSIRLFSGVLLSLSSFVGCLVDAAADEGTVEIAHEDIHVEGMGWRTNRALKKALSIVLQDETASAEYGIALLEDALWVLEDELQSEGYLAPQFVARIETVSGSEVRVGWTREEGLDAQPPDSGLGIETIVFEIDEGMLAYYETVTVSGLESLKKFSPENYFIPGDQWLSTKASRAFTPRRFQRSQQAILVSLREKGFREARVQKSDYTINQVTGAVDAVVEFELNKPSLVGEVVLREEGDSSEQALLEVSTLQEALLPRASQVFSPSWLSNYTLDVRRHFRNLGYPDVRTRVVVSPGEVIDHNQLVDIQVLIERGGLVRIGRIDISGDEVVRSGLLEKRLSLKTNQLFDADALEGTQRQLARLNSFRSIEIEFEEVDIGTRNIAVRLEPLPKDSVHLIGGVGSYDIVRAGIHWERNHLWRLAHRLEVDAMVSLRKTQAEVAYHVPLLLNRNVDFFTTLDWLDREEVSYQQKEWGSSIGLSLPWVRFNMNLTAQYNYKQLEAIQRTFKSNLTGENSRVGSFEFNVRKNELNNPVNPTEGYQLFANVELADPSIGGEVNYDRVTFGGALHKDMSNGLIGRFGLQHGFIRSSGESSANIPVNRRFFLGGENTVRGYKEGEASPLDPAGVEIGAEFFTLVQIELEQKLNQTVSLVIFSDSVGFGASLSDYTEPEWLFSVGVGVRFRTLLGPLRIEYGHNLNPRPTDPKGTLQIGLGLPF